MLNELAVAAAVELWFDVYRRQARVLDTRAERKAFTMYRHRLDVNIFDFVRCQAAIKATGVIEVETSTGAPVGGSRNGR